MEARPESGASAETRARRAQVRLLVAEDNVVNLRLATLMLGRLGYRADVAGNGLEAMHAVSRQNYDVVLMDVQMPEMDGIEATRRIRADAALKQPYIIAVTANVLHDDRQQYVQVGMNAFLAKPFMPAELEAALETAMGNLKNECNAEPRVTNDTVAGLIERERLDEILDLAGEGEGDLLETMVGSLESDMAAFRKLVALEAALPEVVRISHGIKGASYSLGAKALGDFYAGIEQSAKSGDLGAIRNRLGDDASAVLASRSMEALRSAARRV